MIDFDELVEIFSDLKGVQSHHQLNHYENRKYKGLPDNLQRKSAFMTQP
jgi:hypothetical protein